MRQDGKHPMAGRLQSKDTEAATEATKHHPFFTDKVQILLRKSPTIGEV